MDGNPLFYGMGSTKTGYEMANGGTITIINDGSLQNSLIGMTATGGGTITNVGEITTAGHSTGMRLSEGSIGINNGTIDSTDDGLSVSIHGSGTFTNNGKISFSKGSAYGVAMNYGTSDATFINERGAILTGDGGTGVYLHQEGSVVNRGTIDISNGYAAISVVGKGTAENQGTLLFSNTSYGMVGTEGAILTNDSKETLGVSTGNIAGLIVFNGSMAVNQTQSTIDVNGENSSAMWAAKDSRLVNYGTISVNTASKDAYAFTLQDTSIGANGGTVILNSKEQLLNGGLLFNHGTIEFKDSQDIESLGRVVLEKETQVKNASLKDSFIGLSYFQPLYSENDTHHVPLDVKFSTQKVTPFSYVYDTITSEDIHHGRRKSFLEISEDGIGKYLEDIYFDDGNTDKTRLFTALINSENSEEYNGKLDGFFGRDYYSGLTYQTRDIVRFSGEGIMDNLSGKLPTEKKDSYIAGYIFEKYKRGGFSRVAGYEENLNGLYLGKQYRINSEIDLGFVFNYTHSYADFKKDLGTRRDDFFQGNLFTVFQKNDLKGMGNFYMGYSSGKLKRNLNTGYIDTFLELPEYRKIQERLKGDIDNFYLGGTGKLSKRYDRNNYFLESAGKLDLMGVFQRHIGESGGEYALDIDRMSDFFSKLSLKFSLGKDVPYADTTILRIRLIGVLAQELNSNREKYRASLKNISEEKATVEMDRKNLFSQELGVRADILKSAKDALSLHVEYRYIFEDSDSWKISSGINYKF